MIFAIFSDSVRIWILVKFFGSGADYAISISAQHCYFPTISVEGREAWKITRNITPPAAQPISEPQHEKVSDGGESLANHRVTPGKVPDGFRLLVRALRAPWLLGL